MTEGTDTLLIVDDNAMNRDMLARRLEREGYQTEVAQDGQQALNKIVERPFDLVLLDIMMPVLDGMTVLRMLRKTYSVCELPVIMVTAKDESAQVVTALERGANDYVTKPLDFPVALARIQTHLALKRASDQIKALASQLEVRNELIRNMFGRYVASEVVENLLNHPEALELGGELRRVSMLMADLRGFTLLTQQLEPKQVVSLLNNYLGRMIEVINAHQGTVDELMGDGILAFFGAPLACERHAEQAIACALDMQMAIQEVNALNSAGGLPEVQMGIGINTGSVVVGNIGCHRRSKYSVVGSDVNLTARIESYTVGGQVLISEEALAEAGAIVRIEEQRVVRPKGMREPVTIYEVSGIGGKYNTFLTRAPDTLSSLERHVPCSFSLLDEKRGGQAFHEGQIVRLSRTEGEIRAGQDIAELSELEMRLLDESGQQHPGAIYAKVTGRRPGSDGGYSIRFTSISPELVGLVDRILESQVLPDRPVSPSSAPS